jgi:threonine aldolase
VSLGGRNAPWNVRLRDFVARPPPFRLLQAGGRRLRPVDDDLRALRDACDRALTGHGVPRADDLLDTVPRGTAVDRYGDGGVVAELEAEIAAVLGLPAAAYLPSGTMAQQAVLRVHAGRRGRRTVLFHPECHLDRHEGRALERLHGLVGRPVGDRHRLLGLADLASVAELPAALVLELPQRDLGGRLPDWADLEAQVAWARDRGAAAHLDGARLWEASAGYGRTPAQVAALFDTTYVSFYKGLGALAGCCLAGPEDVVAEVQEWRGRMGGTLFGLWPGAASALTCLRRRLPRMPGYLARAREIADAVRGMPGVTVVPDPPQTPMLHLLLRTTPDAFAAAARALAAEDGLWTWERAMATGDPAAVRVELPVGDATTALPIEEIRAAVRLLGGAARA